MIDLVHAFRLYDSAWPRLLHEHSDDKILAMERQGLVFVFNFHPDRSRTDYKIDAPPGKYRMVLNSDDIKFGGYGRLALEQIHFTAFDKGGVELRNTLSLYLPSRTGIVLQHLD
jgi:1,4-alpha-glucan branching enzyme